jgi:hypothetical protein
MRSDGSARNAPQHPRRGASAVDGGRPEVLQLAMDLELINFDSPTEVRTFAKGRFELYAVGPTTLGRATYEPGWKWSEHVGPATGHPRKSGLRRLITPGPRPGAHLGGSSIPYLGGARRFWSPSSLGAGSGAGLLEPDATRELKVPLR